MDLSDFFQLSPTPDTTMTGVYNPYFVILSYVVACVASFVALDITEKMRVKEEFFGSKIVWLIGGAFAMGIGIWTMHFVGMLAFEMQMSMNYNTSLTTLSMFIAVISSGFAFLRERCSWAYSNEV